MAHRRHLNSDSDILTARYSRESISDYLASRRGSLSDLVFNSTRKLSRDSLLNQNGRKSRHFSLTNLEPREQKSSTSLVSLQKTQNSGVFTGDKRLSKHKSSSNLCPVTPKWEDIKKGSKGNVNAMAKRRKWLRKVQSLQTFDSVLKNRTSRQRFVPLVRFRRAARTVLLLLRATASSRHASQGHQDQKSWSQLAEEQSTARRTYDLFGLSFDPSHFKAKREKYLSNEAKAILSLFPDDRSEEQIKLALLALNQTVDAFGEFPITLQKSLASVGWYEHFEAKRVIIRQGHVADNFYFILSGTAVVTLLESNKDTGEECVRTVAFLRKGNSFGELALMHGARRSATVTCQTDVELLAVGREDFIDIFMHIEKDKEPEHIRFLRNIDIFRGWPVDKLPQDNPRICLFTFFRRGVLLCKDSNNTEWIYVIKTGSCRVLKDLLDTRPNIPGLEFIPYSLKQSYIKLPPIPHSKSTESSCPHRHLHIHQVGRRRIRLPDIYHRPPEEILHIATEHQAQLNEIFETKHKQNRRKRYSEEPPPSGNKSHSTNGTKVFVQIQKLVSKDVFGLEQAVFGLVGETTSCSLVSDGAECILINKKFFLQHLSDHVAKHIRRTIQPIPSEESLQQKLQDQTNWDAYKSMTVSNLIVLKKQVHEHEIEAMYI